MLHSFELCHIILVIWGLNKIMLDYAISEKQLKYLRVNSEQGNGLDSNRGRQTCKDAKS